MQQQHQSCCQTCCIKHWRSNPDLFCQIQTNLVGYWSSSNWMEEMMDSTLLFHSINSVSFKARPHVMLPHESIIDLGNASLGLHPELSGFKSLYDEQRLKIIQNVGYDNPIFLIFDRWIFGKAHQILMNF